MTTPPQFFDDHPVFTWNEFVSALGDERTEETLHTQIKYYLKTGKIAQIKFGLYYVKSQRGKETTPDQFLVGVKIAPDSVLGYHSVFDLLGYSHSVNSTIYVLTSTRVRSCQLKSLTFETVSCPAKLMGQSQCHFGTVKVERHDRKVTTTGKERTIVDALDRSEYAGGIEESMRSIEKVPYIDCELMYQYLQLRKKKILFAKAGFLLEQFQSEWFVEDAWLRALEDQLPVSPAYFLPNETGTLLDRWNLIVPEYII